MESKTRRQTAPPTQATPAKVPSAGRRVVSFQLDLGTFADLEAAAKADDRTVSAFLRRLVRSHLAATDGASA